MSFSEEENSKIDAKLSELISLYDKVKKYIIASEKASAENKLSIPAINELRNAFDHHMRASAIRLQVRRVPEESGMSEMAYCTSNIDKAVGHIYRAGYDALDVISLCLMTDIKKIVESVSRTTLVADFAGYSQEIRIPLETAMSTCDAAKLSKDVKENGAGQAHFSRYESAIQELTAIKEKLYGRLPELNAVEAERKATDTKLNSHFKKERNIAIVVAIIIAIISLAWADKHEATKASTQPSLSTQK